MTTIKSTSGKSELHVGRDQNGRRWVRLERDEHGAADAFPTAELLAALDADPTSVAEGLREELRMKQAERRRTAAKLDLVRACVRDADENTFIADHIRSILEDDSPSPRIITADEVRKGDTIRVEWEIYGATTTQTGVAHEEISRGRWTAELGASLTGWNDSERITLLHRPEPTLPTEAPATVVAEEPDGTEHTFELWTDGKGSLSWVDACDEDGGEEAFSPEELLRRFTGHYVVDEAVEG